MGDCVETSKTLDLQIYSFPLTAYDTNLKLKLIKYTKDINTCVATREYNISVANEQ
jgi:hypothetical protein